MVRSKILTTRRGYERLKEKIEYLKTVKREEIAQNMGKAIEDGDLRESAAYDEARLAQSENEALIHELEDQLERSEIIQENAENGAGLGAKIKIQQENGKEVSFELVGTFEADVRTGKISDASPIGKALMGAKVGDKVKVAGPKGNIIYKVLEVSYE